MDLWGGGAPENNAPVRVKKNILGFTLAEVLITLGIIGVVVAMTLPSLIGKYQEKQWKVAYKKAYSGFSQAFLRLQENGELLSMTAEGYDENGTAISPGVSENFKTISKYFNAVKTCFDNNADECWVCDEGQAGYYYSSAPDYLGCTRSSYAFKDNSGMAWYLYINTEWPILVDVNGDKRPNRLGQDRFVMRFADSRDAGNNYASEANVIKPLSDIEEKGRWCPSGHCLYTTWLLH